MNLAIIDRLLTKMHHITTKPLPFLRLCYWFFEFMPWRRREPRCSQPWARRWRAHRRVRHRMARPRTMSRESGRISILVSKRSYIKAYQVVTEKLHDEGRVLVALLGQGVELCVLLVLFRHGSLALYVPAMASSKACLASWQAWSGELRIS